MHQKQMMAVVTTGNGGYDKLEYRAVPRPVPGPGEVLLRVLAAGVNNTDINTRVGWYAKEVTGATDASGAEAAEEGGFAGALNFPLIQGGDLCGRVIALGEGVDGPAEGTRVTAPLNQPEGPGLGARVIAPNVQAEDTDANPVALRVICKRSSSKNSPKSCT